MTESERERDGGGKEGGRLRERERERERGGRDGKRYVGERQINRGR